MVSDFYHAYGKRILLLVAVTFPILTLIAESLQSNNDVETWLPDDAPVRVAYDEFKEHFGAEEVVFIGLVDHSEDDPIVEALRARIERLPEIRQCWSPRRLRTVMAELEVTDADIDQRLERLVVSQDGALIGLIAVLSEEGLAHRERTVEEIRSQLNYCQMEQDELRLAGAPVVVSELNRLGNRENTKVFFMVTLLISLILLYFNIRQWNITIALLGVTVWSINLTLAIVKLSGGEMNFILGALPVMVMVFTLAISIHFVHYYHSSLHHKHPLTAAMNLAWRPCCLATLTTTIGLVSLGVSDIGPVRQFGYAASLGAIVAFISGLGLTPAVLSVFPLNPRGSADGANRWNPLADRMLSRSRIVAAISIVGVMILGCGLPLLTSRIDPLDFLPRDSKVLQDVIDVEQRLANTSSIEAVIELDPELPFVEKLGKVRDLQARIDSHPAVQHTMSAATFFPSELPDGPLAVASLLNRAQSRKEGNGYLASGDRLWRISARIRSDAEHSDQSVLEELQERTRGANVSFTGIAPLLQHAQGKIFDGFWESFATAFVIITVVMMLSLRSLSVGLLAMIPNLTPICVVFGLLGWIGIPVDIGMMMTGSIALGIAVDGTFHYLVRYRDDLKSAEDSREAARLALFQTGQPIFIAAAIAAAGMLALTLSDFAPTAKFGYMMAAMLMAALIGDLVLLPVLLTMLPKRGTTVAATGRIHPDSTVNEAAGGVKAGQHAPHFSQKSRQGTHRNSNRRRRVG